MRPARYCRMLRLPDAPAAGVAAGQHPLDGKPVRIAPLRQRQQRLRLTVDQRAIDPDAVLLYIVPLACKVVLRELRARSDQHIRRFRPLRRIGQ